MDNVVILAQGTFPTHPYPLQCLAQAGTLICTDGAVNTLPPTLQPTWVVGDMDSLSPQARTRYASRLIHNSSQETNDLTKAIEYCHAQGVQHVRIVGATGKREDHSLGNIALLAHYVTLIPDIAIVTDYGVFQAFLQDATLPCVQGSPVSFFALDNRMKLRVTGVQYPTENVVFDSWWKATLNVCCAASLSFSFTYGPLLVYIPHAELTTA